jgi:3',5'-cyclic-AMP phosphodiesterase
MARLAWLTDLHLNFVAQEQIPQLAAEIQKANPSALLIGGDLGEASSWDSYLDELDRLLELPIYFVLGNHDYYGSSLHQVRERARQITESSDRLSWLPASGIHSLDSRTALVGHGGWGDARAGAFQQSKVLLNDYFLITELRHAAAIPEGIKTWWGEPSAILNRGLESQLQELGEETARHFREVVPKALADHEHVIVLMHVPPFREACWHGGQLSDDDWAPHFCCIAAGEALAEAMKQHPSQRMTVLCGHTHGEGRAEILPNLIVHTGHAQYGQPEVQCIIDTDD